MPRRLLFVFVAALALGGCAPKFAQDSDSGYAGPSARFTDTETLSDYDSVNFFYLEKIDGRKIRNGLQATQSANYGHGAQLVPVSVYRDVPTAPAHFTIVGRTHYPTPILEMANTIYRVSGDISFTPVANHTYLVKGVLGATYSAVWIEDAQTYEKIGQKIEVNGSAALDLWEK